MLADLARMVAMVSQILDSVRLERGRVDLNASRSSCGAVARVVGQFEERARLEKIAICDGYASAASKCLPIRSRWTSWCATCWKTHSPPSARAAAGSHSRRAGSMAKWS